MSRIDEEVSIRWHDSSFSVWVSESIDPPPSFSWVFSSPPNSGTSSAAQSLSRPSGDILSDPHAPALSHLQAPVVASSNSPPRDAPQPPLHGPVHGESTGRASSCPNLAADINVANHYCGTGQHNPEQFLFSSQAATSPKLGRSKKRPRKIKSPSSSSPSHLPRPKPRNNNSPIWPVTHHPLSLSPLAPSSLSLNSAPPPSLPPSPPDTSAFPSFNSATGMSSPSPALPPEAVTTSPPLNLHASSNPPPPYLSH